MNNHNYNESTNEICSADIFKRELSYIRMKGDYKRLKQLLLCCFLHLQSSVLFLKNSTGSDCIYFIQYWYGSST